MKYEIENRFTGNTQFIAEIDCNESESESIKKGLALIWAIKNKANLKGADLEGAKLKGADLEGAKLKGADLYEANLEGAKLKGANLRGAKLKGANLRGANLEGANLEGANLYKANLYEANLRGANLYKANLYEANLYKANLYKANLEGADLDFSCLPLWCGSLKANMDDKQVDQILYHLLSIVKNSNKVSDKRKKHLLTKKLLKIANDSHVVSQHNCEEL